MQTPLAELINILNNSIKNEWVDDTELIGIKVCITKATELLEKEKEVICKAFSDGKHHGANGSNPNDKNKRYNYLTSQYWKDAFTDTNK